MTARPPRPGDAEAMGRWLDSALGGPSEAAGRARKILRLAVAADPSLLVIDADGEACGVIVIGWDGDDALIEIVAVRPEARGRGLAARAVIEVEASLAPRPRRLLGPVAQGDGRALYFWLRLGYRPIIGENGRVWMERATTRAPS